MNDHFLLHPDITTYKEDRPVLGSHHTNSNLA
jgi:amino acid permease